MHETLNARVMARVCMSRVTLDVRRWMYECHTTKIHMSDLMLDYKGHTTKGTFICVTWLIHMCDMTHSYLQLTHTYVQHDSYTLITQQMLDYKGSLHVQVVFRKRATNYRALLRKITLPWITKGTLWKAVLSKEAWMCRLFSAKEPLIIGLFCEKLHYLGLQRVHYERQCSQTKPACAVFRCFPQKSH